MANEKERASESPLEKKLRMGLIIGSATLVGAYLGFVCGVSYGKWLYRPISVMEQKLNDDEYPDLSITDGDLNRHEYLGKAGGEYRRRER